MGPGDDEDELAALDAMADAQHRHRFAPNDPDKPDAETHGKYDPQSDERTRRTRR